MARRRQQLLAQLKNTHHPKIECSNLIIEIIFDKMIIDKMLFAEMIVQKMVAVVIKLVKIVNTI